MIVRELIKVLQAHPENALVVLEDDRQEFYIRAIGPVENYVLIKIEVQNEDDEELFDPTAELHPPIM
jgi:hypothetical protein